MGNPQELSFASQKSVEAYRGVLEKNLAVISGRLQETLNWLHGNDARRPRLIAVSKTHPPEAIKAAYDLGLREFGENYAQELKAKWEFFQTYLPNLLPNLRLIYQGRIQSNKIPLMVRYADEIQSVDSLAHAQIIDQQVAKLRPGSSYPIWLLVNAGQETTKLGFSLEDIPTVTLQIVSHCHNLTVQGIMAIPPPLEVLIPHREPGKPDPVPPLYQQLAQVARAMPLPQGKQGKLSLGMSEDLEVALAVGTDCLRLGTAIFGPRLPKEAVG